MAYVLKFPLITLLTINLSACATGLTSDIRQHAQDVFLYHNQLVSQLILLSSDTEISDAQLLSLEQAETSMITACKPLNQVAAKVRDGGKPSLRQRASIPRVIKKCEAETQLMEQLMAKF